MHKASSTRGFGIRNHNDQITLEQLIAMLRRGEVMGTCEVFVEWGVDALVRILICQFTESSVCSTSLGLSVF